MNPKAAGPNAAMIDIHSHIIPKIDDGVQSDEAAVELITREYEGGTRTMVATPHVQTDHELKNSAQIVERLNTLREVLKQQGVLMNVVQGAELYPMFGILSALDAGLPVTVAGKGKHVLVDLPMGYLPMDMDQLLFEIQSRGITPILAHPERCGTFQESPDKLEPYIERGICCQINARSLKGKYGPRAGECAVMFLRRRLAHFIASDAHAPRPEPILAAARADAGHWIDDAYWRLLTVESGTCLLEGQPLPPLPAAPAEAPAPEKMKKKGLLGRLFGG